MWKETVSIIAALTFTATACGRDTSTALPEPTVVSSASERVGVENRYSWQSHGETTFDFDAIDFPGTFYPDAITQALEKYCNKPLVVPKVTIAIKSVYGFNTKTRQPDPNGVRAITVMKSEKKTNKPVELTIGIAGGRFQNNRIEERYYYTSPHLPNEKVLTNALFDLNGSIAEEIGYHACIATVGTHLDKQEAQAESARFHMDFLKNPTIMFRPKGW